MKILTPAEEREALLHVREKLSDPDWARANYRQRNSFACIGFWMGEYLFHNLTEANAWVWANSFSHPGPYTHLFFGDDDREKTPAEGIAAIDAFLAGNRKDPWCRYA